MIPKRACLPRMAVGTPIRMMKLLLAILGALCFASPVFGDPAKWEKEIAAFERADAENPPPRGAVLFIGSSSIRLWKTLAADFPGHRVINRGFGGSEMGDSAAFVDRIVVPYAPRMIVIYAGGNDINAKKTPQRVVEDFKTFVAKARAKLPDVEIAFISIAGNPARWEQVAQVREANRLIEEVTRAGTGLKFINTFDAMLGRDGNPRPEIFVQDRLHMNEKGYVIWREVIGKFLPKP